MVAAAIHGVKTDQKLRTGKRVDSILKELPIATRLDPTKRLVPFKSVYLDWPKRLVSLNKSPETRASIEELFSTDSILTSPIARAGSVIFYLVTPHDKRSAEEEIWISRSQVKHLATWARDDGLVDSSTSSLPMRAVKDLARVRVVSLDNEEMVRTLLCSLPLGRNTGPLKRAFTEETRANDDTEAREEKKKSKLAVLVNKKRALPTPSPSIESSPEPTAVVKKLKVFESSAESTTPRSTPPPPPRDFSPLECQTELDLLRTIYSRAVEKGGVAFLALDVEAWERSRDALLEVGWTLADFDRSTGSRPPVVTRSDQHVIVSENSQRRNGKFSPDSRDEWDFGPSSKLPVSERKRSGELDSLVLGMDNLYALLSATFDHLSDQGKDLFLIFHDPRMDIRALEMLGFDNDFAKPLIQLKGEREEGKQGRVWIVDTQRIYAGWKGIQVRSRLVKCCEELKVPTKRLHNAGNDAHYTLDLLERLLQTPKP